MARQVGPLLFAAAAAALLAGGCRKDVAKQSADKAEAALDRFLNAWTRNESPEQFAGPGKPLTGADPDWQAGHRLLSFLTVDSKASEESPPRIRCRVALSLRERTGKNVDKEVIYDVQLGEPIVISRAKP